MTNRSDLDECSAQIRLVRQLITQPETFDLDKILVELETKKKLLMTFKPRSYATILEDLESGAIKHPGEWVLEEKKVEIPKPEIEVIIEPEIDPEKEALKAQLEATKGKLAKLEAWAVKKEAE